MKKSIRRPQKAASRSFVTAAFPAQEYANRIVNARKAMEAKGVDVLLVRNTPNVAYLTGYEMTVGNEYVSLVLPLDRPATLHVQADQAALVPRHAWLGDVIAGPDLHQRGHYEQLAGILRTDYGNARIGIEMGRYPATAEGQAVLADTLSSARFVDCTSLVFDLRVVKSPAELRFMRKAAAFTDIGIRAAMQALRVGNTDNDVGAAAYTAMLRAGSEAPYPAPFIHVGERTGWGPHLTWKRNPILPGDTINLELSGVYNRYVGPIYRTAVMGKPSDYVRRVSDACIDTLNTMFSFARPGMTAHEIATRAQKQLDPVRSEIYTGGSCGYSIGITISPNWVEHSFRMAPGNHRPVLAGMTFHSPIAVRWPGKIGIAVSEAWTMTEKGAEVLTDMPRELLVCET
ncbi:MAG: aminopeptidase P family protein [Rhodospirillales bacterium]|nr:aminopeptidase P family protein [Rhodospirillales bacterium]